MPPERPRRKLTDEELALIVEEVRRSLERARGHVERFERTVWVPRLVVEQLEPASRVARTAG